VRLFLPVFPFLALLAGLGGAWLLRRLGGPDLRKTRLRRVGALALVGLALGEAGFATVRLHPFQASYFNALAGGIPGAQRNGLEVTGMKEVLSRDVYADLSRMLPPGASLEGGPFLYEDLLLAQALGWLDSGVSVRWDQPADYVLIVNRMGWLRGSDLALLHFGRPVYQLSVEGVALVALFRLR
jgi:hypothetical protein